MRILTGDRLTEAHLPMDLYLDVTEEDRWSVLDRVGAHVPNEDVRTLLDALMKRERTLADVTKLPDDLHTMLALSSRTREAGDSAPPRTMRSPTPRASQSPY